MRIQGINHLKYCTGCEGRPCIVLNIVEDADHLPPCGNEGERWYYVQVKNGSHNLAKAIMDVIEDNDSMIFLDRTEVV